MQRATIVRYTTKADRTAENETLSRAVFAELRTKAPSHIVYAVFRAGSDFLHVFLNLRDGDAEALTGLPSFQAFSAAVGERQVAAPEVTRLEMQLLDVFGVERLPLPA